MRAWAVILAVLAMPGVGAAQPAELPHFEPEAHCRRIAAFSGTFSQSSMNGCLQNEQRAYNALRDRWPGLPAATRAHCSRIASAMATGSYFTLQGCVQNEEAAAQQNQQFQFRR